MTHPYSPLRRVDFGLFTVHRPQKTWAKTVEFVTGMMLVTLGIGIIGAITTQIPVLVVGCVITLGLGGVAHRCRRGLAVDWAGGQVYGQLITPARGKRIHNRYQWKWRAWGIAVGVTGFIAVPGSVWITVQGASDWWILIAVVTLVSTIIGTIRTWRSRTLEADNRVCIGAAIPVTAYDPPDSDAPPTNDDPGQSGRTP